MDTDTADELDQLRARAYGPAADIHTDAAAQLRLRELEDLARGRDDEPDTRANGDSGGHLADAASMLVAAPPVAAPPVAAPPVAEIAEPERGKASPAAASTASDAVPASRGRLSRTVRLLWPASILATAAVAAAVTYGLVAMTPVSVSSGAPQIATLTPQSSGVKVPAGWFGAGPSSRTWEFYGLTLFETSAGMFGGTGNDCLMVVTTADLPEEGESTDNWSVSGISNGACGAGAFPATLEIAVDSSAPEELRAAFPDSTLQFVKRGDDIGVFQDKH
ncbi:hypothetical protein JNB62_08710 [Microbacterium jejuense]|uniref:Spermidine/putrescine ABC transporter permease n=1 Tax=Microbacterium jejuense TaxID=1263637 RepID=A0ABS7HMV8_9MICO|nr:hypothetical protein [Microbacterium jejuense]MBW9093760.1 hypothetical protein [Microbacterium jejuense]